MDYGKSRTVGLDFATAVTRVKEALKEQGFGVLSEIDVKKTLKEKLGVDVPEQVILGACNPKLAHAGLTAEPELGLLLPCNVTVRIDQGVTRVSVIDAKKMMDMVGNPDLAAVAAEANERLDRVLECLPDVFAKTPG